MLSELAQIVGEAHIKTAPEDKAPFEREWRGLYHNTAQAVVLPKNTAEVAAIVKLCSAHSIPLTVQGGNTGLVGGQMPDDSGKSIILSLTRMKALRSFDDIGGTLTVEAGMTLHEVQSIAAQNSWLFPVSLASEGSCTIGGNIATNAGGLSVIAYGMMRQQVLGLEVVLADGSIWHGLKELKKNNFGPDFKQLFIGTEGRFGIITAAVLALQPRPAAQTTLMLALEYPQKALDVFSRVQKSGIGRITAYELIPQLALQMVLKHKPESRAPFAQLPPWAVLLEVSGSARGLNEDVEALIMQALEAGDLQDAVRAQSLQQAEQFWLLRHLISEVQSHEGGSIKHDVAVPVRHIPALIAEACEEAERLVPACRPLPFGHVGDGNIHLNISQPVGMDKAAFLAHWDAMNEAIHAIVLKYEGSIAAEHGVGRLKAPLLERHLSEVEKNILSALQRALAFS